MQSSIPVTVRISKVSTPTSRQVAPPERGGELVPRTSVVRVQPRTFRSITDLLLALACVYFEAYTAPQRSRNIIPGGLVGRRWGQAPFSPLLVCDTRGYWKAEISLVIGINQTNHSTNQERPCTTVQRIKKEPTVCQSLQRPDLVTFPVLSQIKPHTPRLVVSFRQFL